MSEITVGRVLPKFLLVFVLVSFSIGVDAQTDNPALLDQLEVITSENADQLEQISELRAREFANAIAFDPLSRFLAVGGESNELGYVQLYELERMNLIADLPVSASRVIAVAFSANGLRFAAGSADGTITIWDVHSWQEVTRFQVSRGEDSQPRITFSADLRLGALTEIGGITLFDIVFQQEVYQIGRNRDFFSDTVTFSSDNTSFVYGTTGGSGIGYSYIHVIDLNSKQETHTFQVSDNQDYAIGAITDFSSDNRLLASTAIQNATRNVIIFDTVTGLAPIRFVDTADQTREIRFAPSANILAVAGYNWEPPDYEYQGTLELWALEPGEWLIDLTERVPMVPWDIEFNQVGSLLVVLDSASMIRLWGVPSNN